MKPYKERLADAQRIYAEGLRRVATLPMPEGQKFAPGTRVRIADDLGEHMRHFHGAGKLATVEYTHAHAYGGKSVDSYSLNVDGIGSNAWYYESQLTPCESDEQTKK